MSLKLYFHPLSSYCHKVLIALYENAIAFEPVFVDLLDETSRSEFKKVWPIAKFPVLRDEARSVTVPESTIIIEYLDEFYPGATRFVPADLIPSAERPDDEYPMVLITGRQLEHWHTGAMTRRSGVLDAIEPEPMASLHPLDLAGLGLKPGDVVTVASRRGRISLFARADEGTPRGAVFIPFAYYEAAANILTNAALDPFGKIPEFKYCAVAVSKGGTPPPVGGFRVVADEVST